MTLNYEPALSDRFAYQRWLENVVSGKCLLQLQAMKAAATPQIRAAWDARTFTDYQFDTEDFDALVCNLSYHFHTHGQKYVTIQAFTQAALNHFLTARSQAVLTPEGLLKLPQGLYTQQGKIVTFFG
jgi:hypothetical protein